jgi:hypothetical protein
MTDAELLKLAEEKPDVVETTISALKRVIEFHRGRGAMLAALQVGPNVARVTNQLRTLH